MRVLLVESAAGLSVGPEAELRSAGHTVVGCGPAEPSSPCRGLEPVATCPLDDGYVDVAVVSRSGGDLTAAERGALCAARRRVPVVITGPAGSALSFGPGTHFAGNDLVGVSERAAVSGTAHVAAIERQLLMSGAIDEADLRGAHPAVSFAVRREPGRLRLVVTTAADDPRRASIIKAAAEALRRFDIAVPVIDVVAADR
jgi:hypothetical protein